MSIHKQAERLALCAKLECCVVFECERCSVFYANETTVLAAAARDAAKVGWRVDDDGNLYCPKCVKENQREQL